MAVITLNVVSMEKAVDFLGADTDKIEELAIKRLIDYSTVDGVMVLDEDQFDSLERVVVLNDLRSKGSETISVHDIEDFTLLKGYVGSPREFQTYLDKGLFRGYRVEHPFSGRVMYRARVLQSIVSAVERGSITTLKHYGYTKKYIVDDLGIDNAKFIDLTKKLKLQPKLFNEKPIYTREQYLSIKKLNTMVKSLARSKSDATREDAIFVHNGIEYVNKENIRLYLGLKYTTVVYLANLGAIRYKEIVHQGHVLTVVSRKDLDMIRECVNKGYRPALTALVLNGLLTLKDLENHFLQGEFISALKPLGLHRDRARYLIETTVQPDFMVQGLKLYRKSRLYEFAKKYVRGTHNTKITSLDFISTTKLAELVGRSPKNIKSYALKYLDTDVDVLKIKQDYFIRLSAYNRLQNDKSYMLPLEREQKQVENLMNIQAS